MRLVGELYEASTLTQPQVPPKAGKATHRHQLSSLQGELGGKAVGDGGLLSVLPLDLPVAQRLVLQGQKDKSPVQSLTSPDPPREPSPSAPTPACNPPRWTCS